MSDTDTTARPRQLTMAAGFVIGGSALLVLTVFDTITRLHSVATHDEVAKMLASTTGAGLGISVSEALSAMRVGLMVAAACAAATAVLGVYALQRSRPARMALSVLAVPLLLTAPLTGGLLGALVAAAILLLWSGQSRDWFAGRPVRQLPAPPPRSAPPPPPSAPTAPHESPWVPPPAAPFSTSAPSAAPGATTGFGERPAGLLGAPPASDATWPPMAHAEVVPSEAVPVTVKVACVLTWVFSGMVALMYAGALVVLAADQSRMVGYVTKSGEWQRANLDPNLLAPVLWIGCLLFLGWALGACVLAWFTWRRHNWARWLLVVSAAVALVAALFAFPVGLLHQLAAGLTIAGLFGVRARAWFDRAPWAPGPPSQGGHAPRGPEQPPPGGKPPVW